LITYFAGVIEYKPVFRTGFTCVCGQDTATKTFTIIMREIGDVNVSITVS